MKVLVALAVGYVVGAHSGRRDLDQVVASVKALRESDELGWMGDSDAAGHAQDGAEQVASGVPTAVSAVLGVAGEAAAVALAAFTLTFVTLFFLTDVERLKGADAMREAWRVDGVDVLDPARPAARPV